MPGRAVIIHSLEQAKAALAAAADLGCPVTLLSAEGAAGSVGPLWFREVVALAAAEMPGADYSALLDCADRPGHVLAALRLGLKQLRFTGRKTTFEALAAIAAEQGATLTAGEIEALDLLGRDDPQGACRAWLAGKPG